MSPSVSIDHPVYRLHRGSDTARGAAEDADLGLVDGGGGDERQQGGEKEDGAVHDIRARAGHCQNTGAPTGSLLVNSVDQQTSPHGDV